tara:strand:- start:106447 stop:107526 length:1080 start_codon:yes stop_codon:yes gene_type:complete
MTELSIIVPTFNEVDNIYPLYEAIEKVLDGVDWEIIYVDDDSTDGTLDRLEKLCEEKTNARKLHRIARRGLSSACVEGFLSTTSPYLAIIDGDMQHDETKLIEMLKHIRTGNYDLILGSRYTSEGGFGNWSEDRIKASQFATKMSKLITRQEITDPMSGFFMLTRDTFMRSVRNLSLQGYKLLLDIVTAHPEKIRIKDVAYEFRARVHGMSKLDSMVMMEFLFMIIEKFTRGIVPARFILFSAVGASGVLVHFAVLYGLLNIAGYSFTVSQTGATVVAMTSNFFINNWLTYFDKRLRGLKLFQGLLIFYAVCSLGSVANIGVASFVFEQDYTWYISGFAGALIGTVWNYVATSLMTWRK